MTIKAYPILIDSNLYTKTWKDVMYNNMNDYLLSKVAGYKIQSITNNGKVLTSIGKKKNSDSSYEELFYYKCLIDYFINANETLLKTGNVTDITIAKLAYKFDCIRKTIYCKFKATKIFDDLFAMSGISNSLLNGLDYMVLDPSTIAIGSELVIDGNFPNSTNWTLDSGWSVSGGKATHNSSFGQTNIRQTIASIIANTSYILTFDVSGYILSGSSILSIGGPGSGMDFTINGNGSYSFMGTTNSSIAASLISLLSDETMSITNISLKQLTITIVNIGNFPKFII